MCGTYLHHKSIAHKIGSRDSIERLPLQVAAMRIDTHSSLNQRRVQTGSDFYKSASSP